MENQEVTQVRVYLNELSKDDVILEVERVPSGAIPSFIVERQGDLAHMTEHDETPMADDPFEVWLARAPLPNTLGGVTALARAAFEFGKEQHQPPTAGPSALEGLPKDDIGFREGRAQAVTREALAETLQEEWQAETTYPYLSKQGKTEWTRSVPTREKAEELSRDAHGGHGWIVGLRRRRVSRGEWEKVEL